MTGPLAQAIAEACGHLGRLSPEGTAYWIEVCGHYETSLRAELARVDASIANPMRAPAVVAFEVQGRAGLQARLDALAVQRATLEAHAAKLESERAARKRKERDIAERQKALIGELRATYDELVRAVLDQHARAAALEREALEAAAAGYNVRVLDLMATAATGEDVGLRLSALRPKIDRRRYRMRWLNGSDADVPVALPTGATVLPETVRVTADRYPDERRREKDALPVALPTVIGATDTLAGGATADVHSFNPARRDQLVGNSELVVAAVV